jgi:hypothetical protein
MTLRPAIAAAAFFGADRVLQHVQTPHVAFYKRGFYFDPIVECRFAPTYGCDLALMATDTRRIGPKLLTRYPFFKTTRSERTVMFYKGDGSPRFTTVVPTARFIGEHDLAYTLPPRKAGDVGIEAIDAWGSRGAFRGAFLATLLLGLCRHVWG